MSDERVGPCGEHCAVVDECDARGREITRLNAENEKLNVALEGYRDDARNFLVRLDDLNALRAENEKLREALIDTLSSLVASVDLLERGGKKAAPSDKMFAQMLVDYKNSIERGRAAAAALKETGDE